MCTVRLILWRVPPLDMTGETKPIDDRTLKTHLDLTALGNTRGRTRTTPDEEYEEDT